MRRSAATLVAVALVAAACGAPGPSPTPTDPAPASPTPTSEIATGAAVPTAPASAAAPSGRIAVEDPSLLQALPEAVAGNPVTLESIAFTEALADPAFADAIEAGAFGVVVAGEDLASAVVARPRDRVYSEAWFRDWRASYDRGACSQAGGVAATAETEIDGRVLHVGTCAGGLHTFHTWLPRRGVLVSAFAIGEGRFGDLLMAGLRP